MSGKIFPYRIPPVHSGIRYAHKWPGDVDPGSCCEGMREISRGEESHNAMQQPQFCGRCANGASQISILTGLHEGTCFPAGKVRMLDQNAAHQGEDNKLPDRLSRWDLDPKYREEFLLCTEGQKIQETYAYEGLFNFSHNC